MSTNEKPDVLVVGAGIAGLALAGFLRERGIRPTLVERAAEWDRVGWGIGLWGNGVAVLDELGVADEAVARGSAPDAFEVRAAGGDRLASLELPGGADAFLAVHRADLHAALREAVPSGWIRMDASPTAIDPAPEGVSVTLDDGTVERVDAVVGTDGVHSRVREERFSDWTLDDRGTAVWSFWAPDGVDLPERTVSLWGPGTEAFLVDVDGRGLVNVATTMSEERTPAAPARERLAAVAESVGWRLPALVDSLDEETDVFFDRNREVSAERWHRGRVAIAGDAAHAVHPISGMGAALALEDAYVLADELASADSIPEAFADFEARRRKRVRDVKRLARFEEATAFAESPLVTGLRDALVRRTPLFEWFLRRQVDDLTSAPLDDL